MLDTLSDALLHALREPFTLVTTPGERAFWPFLLTSLAIAGVVLFLRTRSPARTARGLLARRVWLHRSALMDYRLIVVNALIKALLVTPIMLSALALAVWVVDALTAQLGAASPSSLSRLEIMALYTAVLFVAWDGSRYVVHRLLHRVPALWEFHKVHHSAETLTPFTVYRAHPVESALMQLRGVLVTGALTGVFFYLFRDRAVQYELLGVNAAGMVFNAAGANLRHSHVWLSYGPVVERIFMSPAQHQIHHSTDPREAHCNFGSALALWDWLGGSLRLARRRPERFGVPAGELNHDPASVRSALAGPFLALARAALPRGRRTSP